METIIRGISRFFSNLVWIAIIALVLVFFRAVIAYMGPTESNQPFREEVFELQRTLTALRQKAARVKNELKIKEEKLRIMQEEIEQLRNESGFVARTTNQAVILKRQLYDIPALQMERLSLLSEMVRADQDISGNQKELAVKNSPSFPDYFKHAWKIYGKRYLLWTAFLIFFAPFLWALFVYYIAAALVEKMRPFVLEDSGYLPFGGISPEVDAKLVFPLRGKTRLFLRSGWCKKRLNTVTVMKLIWNWRYPFVSIAADLCELISYRAEEGKEGTVTITAPYEDLFIARVDLTEETAFVIRPKYLVGVTDGIQVRTHWSFSPHRLLSGRIRQIILCGKGSIFVAGSWGVEAETVKAGENSRIEAKMLLGYEALARYSLCRTETFWHYFRGRSELFDIRIGEGLFLTQNNAWAAAKAKTSAFERGLEVLLNGIGHLLGF